MTTETLTFSKARLARLKEEYASAKAEGKEEFEFDGYTFLIGYASRPLTQRMFTSSALTIGDSNG